jgi:cytoskeletal protein CcmA (bactofilin family)
MADEIRGQIKAAEFPPSAQPSFQPSDTTSANHELRNVVAPATAQPQPVDRREAQQQQAVELTARSGVAKNAEEERSLSMTIGRERTSSSSISTVTRISGKVEFRGLAKIEGEVAGEISGDDIEITPSAVVMARVTANRLKVGGQVNGEIFARERIELLPTARLRCTIITPQLVVIEGAQFDGDCKMPRAPTRSS